MKRDLLVCVPPSTFFEHPIKLRGNNHKFSSGSAAIIVEEIDNDRFNIDYIDYDASLIKRHGRISMLQDSIASLIDQYIPTKKYDYVLVCGQFMTNQVIQLIVTLYFIIRLKELYPDIKIIAGGNDWRHHQFLKTKDDAIKACDDYLSIGPFKEILDMFIWPIINSLPSNVYLVRYFRESYLPVDLWNEINRPIWSNGFNRITNNGFSHSRITPPCTRPLNNLDDIKYFYNEIFAPYDTNIHLKHQEDYILTATTTFSDGCVGRCAYCEYSTSKYIRGNNYKEVIQSYIDLGFNSIFILDCSTNLYAEDMCNWIVKNNIDISWSSSFNIKNTDTDFYKMIFEAGCRIIDIGIESPNNNQLKYINKNITVDDIEKAIQEAHDAQLYISGNYIFGLPYENSQSIADLMNFGSRNRNYIDALSGTIYKMDKGSLMHLHPEEYGIKLIDVEPYIDVEWGINTYEWIEDNPIYPDPKIMNRIYIRLMREISIYFHDLGIFTDPQPQQQLIFALYKINKNKQFVTTWLKNHCFF